MLKFKIKIATFILFISFIANDVTAQPLEKQSEKVQMLKKIKLLEVLDLNEADADKFLVKYNASESNIRDKHDALKLANDELELALRAKQSDKELNDKINKMMISQQNVQDALANRLKEFKELLTPVQFAKYLVFEKKFMERLKNFMRDGPDSNPDQNPRLNKRRQK